MEYNLILKYPKNFKKSAAALPDQLIADQIKLIYLLLDIAADPNSNADPAIKWSAKHYSPQRLYLFQYQKCLFEEAYNRGWSYYTKSEYSECCLKINRISDKKVNIFKLFQTAKWEPCLCYGSIVIIPSFKDIRKYAISAIKENKNENSERNV